MTWTRIDDHFFLRPSVAPLSPLAQLLHIRGQVYSNGVGSDGFVPERVARDLLAERDLSGYGVTMDDLLDELTLESLWERLPKGWQVDMTDQEEAVVVKARADRRRAARRAVGRTGGRRSGEVRREARRLSVLEGQAALENVIPLSASKPRPVPSRPVGKSEGLTGEVIPARGADGADVDVDEEPVDAEKAHQLSRRIARITDWWEEHTKLPSDEEDVLAVAMDCALPLNRILDVLDVGFARAKQPPRTLRYFWRSLERAESDFFKEHGGARPTGGSRTLGDLLAERLGQQVSG